VGLLFSKGGRDALLSVLDTWIPQLHAVALNFLEQQTRKYLRKPGDMGDADDLDEDQSFSLISFVWNGFIFLMLLFFVFSIVESLAKRQVNRTLNSLLSRSPPRSGNVNIEVSVSPKRRVTRSMARKHQKAD
jgi:hypothetical protein